MYIVVFVLIILGNVSLLVWLWLLLARGRFWCTDQQLDSLPSSIVDTGNDFPPVSAVVPARNEADLLPATLPSLLTQDYPGNFHVYLLDDRSSDGTADVALRIARECDAMDRLTVCQGENLPPGWKGKVWAMHQGVLRAGKEAPEYLLLTDADVAHAPGVLLALVAKLRNDHLDLVSLMANLRVASVWDRLLIPAFVYFFSKLYPFRWVNDPRRRMAGAAGGCILLRRETLQNAGGLKSIANEIIDDCALGKLIKRSGGHIWMGMTHDVKSVRPYETLSNTWNTVARTGFDQLHYSMLMLIGTVLGMLLVYLIPPLGTAVGAVAVGALGHPIRSLWLLLACPVAWILMSASYLPMLRRYRVSPLFAPLLPVSATLYTLMTISSALRYWRGHGGEWKGRTYEATDHNEAHQAP